MNEEQLKEIAAQLRQPSGDGGLKIADAMHESNIAMTLAAIDSLQLKPDDRVLEIGHGNCAHLNCILEKAANIKYHGIDISGLMNETAISLNRGLVDSKQAEFTLYDGNALPFEFGSFDKIMTVNTIYFWNDPAAFIQEIWKVLKADGIFSIGFGQKAYMEKLPFTGYGFKLYDNVTLNKLIKKSGFKLSNSTTYKDQIISKTGEAIERVFTVATMQKVRIHNNYKTERIVNGRNKKMRGMSRYFRNLLKLNPALKIQLPLNSDSSFDYVHLHCDNTGLGNLSFKKRKPHLDALFRTFSFIESLQKNSFKNFQCWIEIYEFDSYNDRLYLHTANHNKSDFPFINDFYSEKCNFTNPELIHYFNNLQGFRKCYYEIYYEDDFLGRVLKRCCLLYKPGFGLAPIKTLT